MQRAKLVVIFALLISSLSRFAVGQERRLVPDSETAIALAKVILKPIHGQRFVEQKVFNAVENDGVWIVKGKAKLPPDKIATGGVVEMHISVVDARVVHIHLHL